MLISLNEATLGEAEQRGISFSLTLAYKRDPGLHSEKTMLIPSLLKYINAHGSTFQTCVSVVPPGSSGFLLSSLFPQGKAGLARPIVFVALDKKQLQIVREVVTHFAIPHLCLEPWDSLPYEVSSPNPALAADRANTLTLLAEAKNRGDHPLLLLSAESLLQRLPKPETFQNRLRKLKVHENYLLEDLKHFLQTAGYVPTDLVYEPGEYALRGGVMDVFSPTFKEPLRLDFFGDELTQIRHFDPATQRGLDHLSEVTLTPAHEISLDSEAVQTFRDQYRRAFGVSASEDVLYRAISEGRLHAGFEHWLPFFFKETAWIGDYAPGAYWVLSGEIWKDLQSTYEEIQDQFQARQTRDAKARFLTPAALFMTPQDVKTQLKDQGTLWLGAEGEGPLLTLSPLTSWTEKRQKLVESGASGSVLAAAAEILNIAEGRVFLGAPTLGALNRLQEVLKEQGLTRETESLFSHMDQGFEGAGLFIMTERDILGERAHRRVAQKGSHLAAAKILESMSTFRPGDLLVHLHHGIGRFLSLQSVTVGGVAHECVVLEYQDGDKLFVPVENLDVLSRFGSDTNERLLDKLGSPAWRTRREKVRKKLFEIAHKLLALAAERLHKKAQPFLEPEALYTEFCARFPYQETEDQERTVQEILADLASGHPMDRLVCGDVGFGKTEVALRAAFVVACSGAQVAVVVPTTLLARQHFSAFEERCAGLGLRVAELSRMISPKVAAQIREDLVAGKIDILIATHAAFARSVRFKDLGLLIVDEEQHFGVKQKERLKAEFPSIHVLTLTATPIPRTLQMALHGVRSLSLLTSPPVDRLAVRTHVLEYDRSTVRDALMREHLRGGQSFFVVPRVEDIERMRQELQDLVPELRLGVAHGQLTPRELEGIMEAFCARKLDLLLCTNIIESGLDIPTANTIFIHRADRFGLAQLYQLRGRVGRARMRGYAYLTTPPNQRLTEDAHRRLSVMQTLDTLGVGFSIASHDMDIRGAGNLVGEEQSGHVKEVGVELYQQMLKSTVEALAAGATLEELAQDFWEDESAVQLSLGTSVNIPESYIPAETLRLSLYRTLASARTLEELDQHKMDLIDRFGSLPADVSNLFQTLRLKVLSIEAHIEKIEAGPKGILISFHKSFSPDWTRLMDFLQKNEKLLRLRPDNRLVIQKNWPTDVQRLENLIKVARALGQMGSPSKPK